MNKRRIILDEHDEALANNARAVIDAAVEKARKPSGVAKRIVARAMYHRNRKRRAAIARHPFHDICEKSGLPIDKVIASFDEIEPEEGYVGKVRWVCQKANNDGLGSCGKC